MTFLQKSWLLYAVQPCLSRKKMLHTASLNLVLQWMKEELSSNHEEADRKVILHCYRSMQQDPSKKIVLRLLSGDTIILVLATALLDSNHVYLDYGKGKPRKGFWLNQVIIEDQLKKKSTHWISFIHWEWLYLVLFQEREADVLEDFKEKLEFCWSILSTGRKLECWRRWWYHASPGTVCLFDVWLTKIGVGECCQIKTLQEEVHNGRKSNWYGPTASL